MSCSPPAFAAPRPLWARTRSSSSSSGRTERLARKDRTARQQGSTYGVESHALPDAQRALRTIRARAKEWKVDPARLGVLGFSAGGELAALAAQGEADGDANATSPIDRESGRAAFQVLVYPGRSESIAPNAKSPPAFLLCGENDRPDISQGLAKVYLRFKEAGVSAELHVLAAVGHGFGVRASNRGATARWLDLVRGWLDDRGFLSLLGANDFHSTDAARSALRNLRETPLPGRGAEPLLGSIGARIAEPSLTIASLVARTRSDAAAARPVLQALRASR